MCSLCTHTASLTTHHCVQQQEQQDTESEHTPTPEVISRAQLRTHDTHDTDTEHVR